MKMAYIQVRTLTAYEAQDEDPKTLVEVPAERHFDVDGYEVYGAAEIVEQILMEQRNSHFETGEYKELEYEETTTD
jgi:hypothetical protein